MTVEVEVEVEVLKRKHADREAQHINEMENLKGRILHRLIEETHLLEEGLHALTRSPPKVHVMVDHAERAITNLRKEIDNLRT